MNMFSRSLIPSLILTALLPSACGGRSSSKNGTPPAIDSNPVRDPVLQPPPASLPDNTDYADKWNQVYYVPGADTKIDGTGYVRGHMLWNVNREAVGTLGLTLLIQKDGNFLLLNDNGFRDVIIHRGTFTITGKKIALQSGMSGELFGFNDKICLDIDAKELQRSRPGSRDYSDIYCPQDI